MYWVKMVTLLVLCMRLMLPGFIRFDGPAVSNVYECRLESLAAFLSLFHGRGVQLFDVPSCEVRKEPCYPYRYDREVNTSVR